MNGSTKAWVVLASGVLSLGSAGAATYYTVDLDTDELVSVSAAGTVSVVGAIGFNAHDLDLAFHQGVLYGLNNAPFPNGNPQLFRFDLGSGASTLVANVGFPTQSGYVSYAEGLGSNGTELVLTRTTSGAVSNSLQTVDLATGATTVLSNTGRDIDGIGFDGSRFVGVDAFSNSDFYAEASPTWSSIGSFSGVLFDDLVVFGGQLTTLSNTRLYQFATGPVGTPSSVALTRAGNYSGIEAVPEPATLALVGLGAAALLRRRRYGNAQ